MFSSYISLITSSWISFDSFNFYSENKFIDFLLLILIFIDLFSNNYKSFI